jgi:hypothetical protein
LEAIVLVKNVGPCVAREVRVGLEGLPGAFVVPPVQEITELSAGGIRYVTFNLMAPQAFRGEVELSARVSEGTGSEILSEPARFEVGGMPIAWSVVLGILALVAVVAIVVGTVLYLRAR